MSKDKIVRWLVHKQNASAIIDLRIMNISNLRIKRRFAVKYRNATVNAIFTFLFMDHMI